MFVSAAQRPQDHTSGTRSTLIYSLFMLLIQPLFMGPGSVAFVLLHGEQVHWQNHVFSALHLLVVVAVCQHIYRSRLTTWSALTNVAVAASLQLIHVGYAVAAALRQTI